MILICKQGVPNVQILYRKNFPPVYKSNFKHRNALRTNLIFSGYFDLNSVTGGFILLKVENKINYNFKNIQKHKYSLRGESK